MLKINLKRKLLKVIDVNNLGVKADNFAKKTYARQIMQCTKNMDRYSVNKAKLKNL
jgi:hypothetical protein